MTDKTKCPICGATIAFEPHPSIPETSVAYCDCRGAKVAVIQTKTASPVKASKFKHSTEKKESEE